MSAVLACQSGADASTQSGTAGSSSSSSSSTESSTGTTTSTGMSSTSGAPTTDGGSSTTAAPGCYDQGLAATPAKKILLVVDTSASMNEVVHPQGGPPIDPWQAMLDAVHAMTACLAADPEARAGFALRLMPGPVGEELCGRSAALDIEDWVSAEEIDARLLEVAPQGGRPMRLTLEQVADDADLVVLLSHGVPGCGDDVDPEALDDTVADTIVGKAAPVLVAHVALPDGPNPVKADTEPDGVDAEQVLSDLAMQLPSEQYCEYPVPLFDASSGCPIAIECFFGDRLDPCVWPVPPGDPGLDDVLVSVAEQEIPRDDTCGTEPAWKYAGDLFGDWLVQFCTPELCVQRWNDGGRIAYGCDPGAPG